MSSALVRKAIIPAAGLGTRFLPATKASPKEMLPIVDKPLIQYAAEEALAAGARNLVFITGSSKRAIEDHFDSDLELEAALEAQGKHELLDSLRGILPSWANCIYIRQPAPLGLGHAVLCARPVVGREPFAVLLADELIDAQPGALQQMLERFASEACSIIGVAEVPRERTASYGIVSPVDARAEVSAIKAIVEKPAPAEAPSTLGVIGRYVLTPAVFELLAAARPGRGGEIQLTDAIAGLLARERVLAMRLQGRRFDCGSKLGYLEATVELGLRHPEIGADFAAFLARRRG